MILEYILLLIASIIILAGSFSNKRGPVRMFKESAPILASRLEQRMVTGQGFAKQYPEYEWRRR